MALLSDLESFEIFRFFFFLSFESSLSIQDLSSLSDGCFVNICTGRLSLPSVPGLWDLIESWRLPNPVEEVSRSPRPRRPARPTPLADEGPSPTRTALPLGAQC